MNPHQDAASTLYHTSVLAENADAYQAACAAFLHTTILVAS